MLVVATNGEYGESPDDLAAGETLLDRRRAETARSADALGVHRVVWLGYRDSGMTGWEQNADPASFHQAPLDEAAERVAAVLREEGADVVVSYDWHGNYGHPDHVKAHQVAHRAAELAGTPGVFDATMNRDEMVRWFEAEGADPGLGPAPADGRRQPARLAGGRRSRLRVDVRDYLAQKRASILCHASQVTDTGQFREMSDEVVRLAVRLRVVHRARRRAGCATAACRRLAVRRW